MRNTPEKIGNITLSNKEETLRCERDRAYLLRDGHGQKKTERERENKGQLDSQFSETLHFCCQDCRTITK